MRPHLRLLVLIAPVALYSTSAAGQATARFEDVPARKPTPTPSPPPASEPPRHAAPPPQAAPGSRPLARRERFASWATRGAAALVARGRSEQLRGETAKALSSYTEAIRMDSSYGAAYLALGHLREALGDASQAERAYTEAIRLEMVGPDALTRRAKLRHRLGRVDDALRDLEAAVARDPRSRRRAQLLAHWYVERNAWPAALAVWRRLLAELENEPVSDATRTAQVQVRALSLLAADADPVAAPDRQHPSWVRHAMSVLVRQRP